MIIVDICQHFLMAPISQWAKPCDTFSIRIYVTALADIVSVGSSAAQQEHIKIMLFIILCLSSMLNNVEPLRCRTGILRKQPLRIAVPGIYEASAEEYPETFR